MPITSYDLGLVVGHKGININQRLEIGKRLKFIADHLVPGGRIQLHTPCLYGGADGEEPHVHADVTALQYKEKVNLQAFVVPLREASAAGIMERLRFCDEVWCCPGEGQDTLMSRAMTNQIYRLAQSRGCPDARVFKMIPVWAELPQGETQVKSKLKGKRK